MNSFAQTNNSIEAIMTYLNTVEDGGETKFA